MDFPPISFRFKPGQRITHEAARVLNILLERSSRSSQWEFDPADFEFNQSGGNQSVRLTGNVCCCPFDPVKKVEDDDLEEGPSYTFDTNDRTEAYVLLTTGAELVTGTLPAMADLPRPPVECWQLHLVNLSGSAWRITPPEGVLIGEGEYLDLWPGRSIVIWTDQPETGDPTAYYAEEGRYAYDPLAFTDSATLDETSFGKVTTWTASAAKTATIGDDALNTGSGQYIANLGTAPLDITPETGTIAGRSSLWLPPRQSLLTTVDADGNVIAPQVVVHGAITLETPASGVVVGLGFTAQLQSMYLDAGSPTVQGRRKGIGAVTVRLMDSSSIEVGANQPDGAAQSPIRLAPRWSGMEEGDTDQAGLAMAPYGTAVIPDTDIVRAVPLWTGDIRVPVASGYTKQGQAALQQREPRPVNVLGFVREYDVGDSPQSDPKPDRSRGRGA